MFITFFKNLKNRMVTIKMNFLQNWNKPWIIGLVYLLNIIVFSLLYWSLFSTDFKDRLDLNFIQSLYFSIVTVTTLGFGDIIPDLNSTRLLICIILQVLLGVLNIGLFLNSISHKISLNKEKELNERSMELTRIHVAKVLAILKPIIATQLNTLADIYKSTSTETSDKHYKIKPRDLMNESYFDQVCLIDYYSTATKYGSHEIFAQFLVRENDKFQSDLESFLAKFAFTLDAELVTLINDIQNHKYFEYPKLSLTLYHHVKANNLGNLEHRHLISREHSALIAEDKGPLSMREYHKLLLELIKIIDSYLPESEIEMQIYLLSNIAPAIGSARAKLMTFSGENQIEIDKLLE